MSDGDLPGVLHENTHSRDLARRRHQATFNGKRSDSSQNIAAVLAVIDPGLIDNNLSEQVIDIGVATQRMANDRNLARQ
ncbi:hypothetical protein D3C87_1483770 [compost metagenome]